MGIAILVLIGLAIFLWGMYGYIKYCVIEDPLSGWEITIDLIIVWGFPLALMIIFLFIIPWYLGVAIGFALSGFLLYWRKKSRTR